MLHFKCFELNDNLIRILKCYSKILTARQISDTFFCYYFEISTFCICSQFKQCNLITMDTPTRRSVRVRQSVCYSDSPNEEIVTNSATPTRYSKRTNYQNDTGPGTPSVTKTPTAKKSVNRLDTAFSPKKLRVTRTPSTAALESIVSENSPANIKVDTPTNSRKSNRVCTPNRRYSNINLKINLKEKSVQLIKDVNSEGSVLTVNSSSSEDEYENESTDKENIEKPTTLFDEMEDVEGQKMYSFKTPKKKDGMAMLASNTPKTPKVDLVKSSKTPKTPKTPNLRRLSTIMKTPTSSRSTPNMPTKTPTHVRNTIKKSKSI